ncbi:hypothetical protein [Streptomyces fructofermentans]|uniref:Regulatory protein n=1 Tax=Streptomyces fructofermentans TaxID=152141 RepID=A0A918NP46_9ACTN|nr:hypothetical protein [Streptomyces fructofermentans]GGX84872.1 hypothetical protein GCM10010515_60380 [Streptomyces fructofermentans]
MSDGEPTTTELKTQYAAQVAADLERNAKEQERIGAEVAALQAQLGGLQHDHALLVNLRQTLGGEDSPAEPAEAAPSTPPAKAPAAEPLVPRQASGEDKPPRRKRATAVKSRKGTVKSGGTKASASTSAAKAGTGRAGTTKSGAGKTARTGPSASESASESADKLPTLVELIRDHLARQPEPRSAAEITTALTAAHPDRDIKPKVVRTTTEGLVAKGHVQRTKQGSSVFYTPAEAAEAVAPAKEKDAATA